MSAEFTCDVFLSHSSHDKAIVRNLAKQLQADGFNVWFDEWLLRPGDSILAKINEALVRARVLVLCMSANAFSSDWVQLETFTVLFDDPMNRNRRIIPLRLDNTPIEGVWKQFLYINLHEYERLVDAIRGNKGEGQEAQLVRKARIMNSPILLEPNFKFYDRHSCLGQLQEWLHNPESRVISIIGPGGYGKSRLVSYFLRTVADSAADSPIFCDIICLSSDYPGLSFEALYESIGNFFTRLTAGLNSAWNNNKYDLKMKAYFLVNEVNTAIAPGKNLIIWFDKLEAIQDYDGQLLDDGLRIFLQLCVERKTAIKILLTSKRQIDLSERNRVVFLKPPIELGGLEKQYAQEMLHDLTPATIPHEIVAQACEQVENIPFALEKIAGCLQKKPQLDLSNFLNDGPRFKGDILIPLAQEVFSHLSLDEQHVVRILAIYNRPVPFSAITYSFGATRKKQRAIRNGKLLAILNQLSCVVKCSKSEKLWQMHSIDQEVALATLPQKEFRRLHAYAARYYLNEFNLPEEKWINMVDVEPLLMAFEHYLKAAKYSAAAELLNRLDIQQPPRSSYLFARGHAAKAKALREKLLPHLTANTMLWTNLHQIGLANTRLGELVEAEKVHNEALAIAQQMSDTAKEGASLLYLGLVYFHKQEYGKAIEFYEQAIPKNKETTLYGNTVGHRGNALSMHKQKSKIRKGIIDLRKAAIFYTTDCEDPRSAAFWFGRLGDAYRKLNEIDKALANLNAGIRQAEKINDDQIKIYHLISLGDCYGDQKTKSNAIKYYRMALTLARLIGDGWNEAQIFEKLGLLYKATHPKRAEVLLRRCLAYHKSIESPQIKK